MVVLGRPETPYIYEFEVVVKLKEDTYFHIEYYDNGFEAEQRALTYIDGLIIHNVKIQGKRLRD